MTCISLVVSLLLGLVKAATISLSSSGCLLPPIPDHGNYKFLNYNESTVPGDLVITDTALIYSCADEGYQLSPINRFSLCEENNEWSALPGCYKTCTLHSSYTLDYSCYFAEEKRIPCRRDMVYNSSVHFKCKAGHVPSPTQALVNMRCREDGTWNTLLTDCEPDCGQEKSKATPLIVNAPVAERDTVPWNVAVFENMAQAFDHICGGTILNSRVVISAAHCYYDDNRKKAKSVELYRVAANKRFRQWGHRGDDAEQTSEILQIHLHNKYYGEELSQASDVALLVLKSPFELSGNVRPICYNLNNGEFDEHLVASHNLGKVAGWGLTEDRKPSEVLRVLSLPVIEDGACKTEFAINSFTAHFTSDKFCGGYLNGTAVCNGDSGAGLVFRDDSFEKRWYLRGIVSTAPRILSAKYSYCNENTYTAFTRIFTLRDWILGMLSEISSQRGFFKDPLPLSPEELRRSGCALPVFPKHGRYTVYMRKKAVVPGEKVPVDTELTYSCDEDLVISEKYSICGQNNKWSDSPVCSKCTMKDTGIVGECRLFVKCQAAMEAASEGLSPQKCYDDLVCCAEPICPPLPKGAVTLSWSGSRAADYCIGLAENIFPCKETRFGWKRGNLCPTIPDPGKVYHFTPVNTTDVAPHYGRFGLDGNDELTWWQYPVTLVSNRWVVCSAYRLQYFGSAYVNVIGLGGSFTPQNYTPDEVFNIKRILIHPEFDTSYSVIYNDIALVQLERQVVFTNRILPACLHTGSPLPTSGLILTGGGDVPSAACRTSMKLFPNDECSNVFSDVLPDGVNNNIQICSRPVNTTGECRNTTYTGSPLFLYNGIKVACTHLLVGIFSERQAETCTFSYARIAGHLPWIESNVWP